MASYRVVAHKSVGNFTQIHKNYAHVSRLTLRCCCFFAFNSRWTVKIFHISFLRFSKGVKIERKIFLIKKIIFQHKFRQIRNGYFIHQVVSISLFLLDLPRVFLSISSFFFLKLSKLIQSYLLLSERFVWHNSDRRQI